MTTEVSYETYDSQQIALLLFMADNLRKVFILLGTVSFCKINELLLVVHVKFAVNALYVRRYCAGGDNEFFCDIRNRSSGAK